MEVLLGKIVAVHQQYCKDKITGSNWMHVFSLINITQQITDESTVQHLSKDSFWASADYVL